MDTSDLADDERELRAALVARERSQELPERIGHYRILRQLGQGGMATVYLAQDERLQRQVAVKCMRHGLRWVGEARLRFQREVLAASRLDHPGVCQVYEAGEENDTPFMVMRFVPGVTLAQVVAAAREEHPRDDALLPAETWPRIAVLVALVEKAARAMHVAHEHGLVHRDLKPANLMVTPDGQPVVLDFGVAHDALAQDVALTGSGQMLGTPLYMAPEQVSGLAPIDRRTDVHALALILYEALTLDQPFAGPTHAEIYRKVCEVEPPDVRHHLPAAGADLSLTIATGLAKDPDHRYHSALAFAEDLRCVREHRPIAARRPSVAIRLLRWSQRNPMAATLVLVLLLGTGGMSWLWREARASERRFQTAAIDVTLQDAVRLARDLHPATPELLPRLRDWIPRFAYDLERRLPDARRALAEVQGDDEGETPRFLRSMLERVVPGIERLLAEDLPSVASRIAWAESVDRVTLAEPKAQWAAAIAAIHAHPRYQGLELRPQRGLVPMGPDPQSTLWEFVALETGRLPERDPATGRLRIDADSGIVLVLLPPATFRMGRETNNAPLDQQPQHEVTLAAFFMGKYEVTQAQWLRMTRSRVNPSARRPDKPFPSRNPKAPGEVASITLVHPVESISPDLAARTAGWVGLCLPTEAQWEYAAGAGTGTAWYCGKEQDIEGHANLNDQSSRRFGAGGPWLVWNDGFPGHAPVGTFAANPFGLHDVIGNVAEICGDWRGQYALPVRAGDGAREVAPAERSARPIRGGGFGASPLAAYTTYRGNLSNDSGGEGVGCRAARAIEP